MEKIFTVAILGVGARGFGIYGKLINEQKDKFRIVAVCDKRKERLQVAAEEFGVAEDGRFLDESALWKKKLADILIIATQDKDHYAHLLKAFETGYDVLCEKPLTGDIQECYDLLAAQKKHGNKVLVCHVLRYAPAFMKVGELLSTGKIGRLISIDALERVGYWHQAHSYVRGNWRTEKEAMAMILAKCCHDLDLLQFYANAKCETISSIGERSYFNEENALEGSADRCCECKHIDTCPYSAKRIYIDRWENAEMPQCWPYNVLTNGAVTKAALLTAIETGPYGRCVFKCDNDVVDNQIVMMSFTNGVKATLTMTGFTSEVGRRMVFHGTLGDIVLDETQNMLRVCRYGEDAENISMNTLNDDGYGHGGGDKGLVDSLYDIMTASTEGATSLAASIESHLMGIAAEESRKFGGKLVCIHHN